MVSLPVRESGVAVPFMNDSVAEVKPKQNTTSKTGLNTRPELNRFDVL